ncbi:MAG: 4Fe-4S cluster-binding domain-containing protein [Clostridia bacterium]|nr:4Fe-4S cluster-binding domain-containing protein [Clostridia bacterium]
MEGKFLVARAGLHFWEEPPISGTKGSGTVFFGGCLLKCVYCQNYKISRKPYGMALTGEQLTDIICYLQDCGAHNINLVTPSHYIKLMPKLLENAKKRISIPILYNCGGYENLEGLKRLDGLVDIYLPDFKYGNNALGRKYSGISDYFDVACAALAEMRRQQPDCVFDSDGIMQRGMLVRHLVLPGMLVNSKKVLKCIADLDKSLYVSLMCQYFPPRKELPSPLNRRLTQAEYDNICYFFDSCGLSNGFTQELSSATEDYVPDFDLDLLKEVLDKSTSFSDKKE